MHIKYLFPAILLAATGCAQEQSYSEEAAYEESMDTVNVSEQAEMGPPPPASIASPENRSSDYAPNVGVSAAPGVAFNYRYAFRVPNAKIAAVQEQHAVMCEELGLDRCRITGMRYRLVDNDTVTAMLAFKLDPAIARKFGTDAIGKVDAAEGMLVDSEISGVDAGAKISDANVRIARGNDELKKAEDRAKNARTSAERVQAQQRVDELKRQIEANRASRAANEESLATTPMVFHYGSGDLISGFNGVSPIREAASTSAKSFMVMLGVVLTVLGVTLPWVLLFGGLFWLYRRFKPAGFSLRSSTSATGYESPKAESSEES